MSTTSEAQMKNTFGPEYAKLHDEVAELHWLWKNYCKMFVDSKTDFELLNSYMPGFLALTYNSTVRCAIAAICKLTDPPKSLGKTNLSFKHLRGVVKPMANTKQLAALDADIKALYSEADKLRDYRNKKLIHLDLHTALTQAKLLPKNIRETINKVLTLLAKILNSIRTWKPNPSYVDFTNPISMGDAVMLIRCVKEADELRKLQRAYHSKSMTEKQIIEQIAR
jgi:hypothetical protein